MLTVGDKFPEFNVQACTGLEPGDLKAIHNGSYEGQWKVYLFYPKDFTFVCPTELVEFGKRLKEFKDRDAMIIGGSTDNEFSHLAWRQQHKDLRGLPYPLIAAQKLACDLGILDPQAHACLRATFIVDPQETIQWACANPLSVGRNVDEVLRVLAAIQSGELTACNWEAGDPYLKT